MSDMPNGNPKKLVHSLSIKNELYSGPFDRIVRLVQSLIRTPPRP